MDGKTVPFSSLIHQVKVRATDLTQGFQLLPHFLCLPSVGDDDVMERKHAITETRSMTDMFGCIDFKETVD